MNSKRIWFVVYLLLAMLSVLGVLIFWLIVPNKTWCWICGCSAVIFACLTAAKTSEAM